MGIPIGIILIGSIASMVRVGPYVVERFLLGRHPPPFDVKQITHLGIQAIPAGDDNINLFQDVEFQNAKDGTRLSAVMDSGIHRVPGKRPIVFVHGFPEMWISWWNQMLYFQQKGHPVLALNMRGYGLSEKPNDLDSFDLFHCLAGDVRAAVKYIVESNRSKHNVAPLLVGHDWGAIVGWAYASQGQTRQDHEIAGYASLTIPPIECFRSNMTLRQIWATAYTFFFNMPRIPEKLLSAKHAFLMGLLLSDTQKGDIAPWKMQTYRANCLQRGTLSAQLNYYRFWLQKRPQPHPDDVLGPLPKNSRGEESVGRRLDLPVVLIRAKQDRALTKDLFRGYDRYLSNACLVELDNCSHWIQNDCSDQLNVEIDKLLQRIGG